MKRPNVIRSGVITSTIVLVWGTWAWVQAQRGPAANKPTTLAQQSSDAARDFRGDNAGATSSRALPRGGTMSNYMSDMMRGMGAPMTAAADPEMAKLAEAEGELAHTSE